jgi:hypothetical protein
MPEAELMDASKRMGDELNVAFSLPLYEPSDRKCVSHWASSLSLEHASAVRLLLANTLVSSALVAHRAQYEAAVRAVWAFYAATAEHIEKLTADLTLDAEQSAKNLPTTNEMIRSLAKTAPPVAYQVLLSFKESSWGALNSYAHAGIHPLRRHSKGYPVSLIEIVQKHANAIAIVAGMQAAILTGSQPLVHEIGLFQLKYKSILPALA